MKRYYLIFALFSLLLVGCSPNVVTVEKTHTEYVHSTDTLTIKDTVRSNTNTIIREARPEDSLLLAQYGIRLRDNERMLLFLQKQLEQEKSESREVVHDTTIVRDTIPQIVTVEKELSWLDRQKIALEGMLKLLAVGFLFFVFIKLKK
jgi:PBP1b-binding outer membrane lipoprotein LpoB